MPESLTDIVNIYLIVPIFHMSKHISQQLTETLSTVNPNLSSP